MMMDKININIPDNPEDRLERVPHYMIMAHLVAMRGTCKKQRVGCILTHNNRVISTGYNSSHSGTGHCADKVENCLLNAQGRCRKVLHSEISAVLELKENYKERGFTAYVTHHPCSHCYQVLTSAGCKAIYYNKPYVSNDDEEEILRRLIGKIQVFPIKTNLSKDSITINL